MLRCCAEKFYNHGERVPQKIHDELAQIDFCSIRLQKNQQTNHDLKEKLREYGWKPEFRVGSVKKYRIDFHKDNVGLEIQLRQDTNLLNDLMKLELGYRTKRNQISYGILITYDQTIIDSRPKKSGMYASLQEVDRVKRQFQGIMRITIPLWILGLKAPDAS